jgi:transposase
MSLLKGETMGVPHTQEIIDKVVKLRSSGVAIEEIAKQIDKSPSVTQFIWFNNKPKGRIAPNNADSKLHQLTDDDRERVKDLDSMPGKRLSAADAGAKLNLSPYNIYKARKEAPVKKRTKKQKDTGQLEATVAKLRLKHHMTLDAIAGRLHKPRGTVGSAWDRYREKYGETLNPNGKGALNGNHTASTTAVASNGNGHKGWTQQNFEGAFAIQVIKLSEDHAPAYQRFGSRCTAEALRQRCAELLQDEVLR